MSGNPKKHSFVALVDRLEIGMMQHFIPVPDNIADELMTAASRRRIVCQVNGEESRRALHGNAPGQWKLVVNKAMLRAAGARRGYPVEVVIWADPDPESIDTCEEFEAVLEQDPVAKRRYEALSLGLKRSFAYYVNGGKRSDTRIKRSLEMAKRLRTEEFSPDRG